MSAIDVAAPPADPELALLRAWLSLVPQWHPAEIASAIALRLSSLTNTTYRVELGGERFCVRIPGNGTSEFIDRRQEAGALQAIAPLGISPQIVFASPATGFMVSRFVPNAVPMSASLFRTRSTGFAEAAGLLRAIHKSGVVFAGRFDVFALVRQYREIIRRKGIRIEAAGAAALSALTRCETVLAQQPSALVACHCDPICENFIHDGYRMWLVDWEYCGMNDPLWDLGDFMIEAGTTEPEERLILAAYLGREAFPWEHGTAIVYKGLSDLLWGLWGVMRQDASDARTDYLVYGNSRLHRAAELVESNAFGRHLESAGRTCRGGLG